MEGATRNGVKEEDISMSQSKGNQGEIHLTLKNIHFTFPLKNYEFILCKTDNTQMVRSMIFSTCIVLQACTFTKWLFIIVKS